MLVPKFLKDPNNVRDKMCLDIFNYFANFLKIRSTKSLFFFGCGTGIPLLKNIVSHPKLNIFAKIHWADGSLEVAQEAKQLYQESARVRVAHVDISKQYRSAKQDGTILSFWCLRSAVDARSILSFIRQKLTLIGRAVVIFECSSFFRNIIGALAFRPEWRKYCLADPYPNISDFEGDQTVYAYIQEFFQNSGPLEGSWYVQKYAECTFDYIPCIKAFTELYPTVARLPEEEYIKFYLLFLQEIENYDGVVVEMQGGKKVIKIPMKYIVVTFRK